MASIFIGDLQIKLIAFYLPQYHPIPENDQWWGKGFTDWTNVRKARPRFWKHYQPHRPSELGYYDLRLAQARLAQAELAKQHGIYGFCYYHYWFSGKRLLERPFNEVLASGEPHFPFCLCWANESWTRAWDGDSGEHLIRQQYSKEDDREHIHWLIRAFDDERYIRVEGKPLLLVYRASCLPNPVETAALWRDEARKAGISDLFLCRVESFDTEFGDPRLLGFDASVEFQPDWSQLGTPVHRGKKSQWAMRLGLLPRAYARDWVVRYASVVEQMLRKSEPPYRRFPCVVPSWDNSPRRQSGAVILHGSTPTLYEKWLRCVIGKELHNQSQTKLIFINGWIEWGEG